MLFFADCIFLLKDIKKGKGSKKKTLNCESGKRKKKLSAMCACVCSFADVPNAKHSVKHLVRNGLRHQAGTEIQFFICLTVLNGSEIS